MKIKYLLGFSDVQGISLDTDWSLAACGIMIQCVKDDFSIIL